VSRPGKLSARLLAAGITIAAAAGGVGAIGAAPAWQAAEAAVQLQEAPGRELTSGRCVTCHSLEYIPSNAPAMNRGGWQKSIQKMRERFGAPISDEEAQQILDYLDHNYAGKSS
jgi:mono/diheme cytochrome c family protein